MRQALCLKDVNDFNLLVDGKIEFIEFQMVDREICEKPENGWIQLLPYVSFIHLNKDAGQLSFIGYNRPSKGSGEARLQGAFSVGFGGHIDDVMETYHEDSYVNAEGTTVFKMTLGNIKDTCIACAVRELKEEIGFNPFQELEIGDANVHFGLERESNPDEVGQVHLCMSIKANLDEKGWRGFFDKVKPNVEEVENIRAMTIDAQRFIGSLNVAEANKQLVTQLGAMGAEAWSTLVVVSSLGMLAGFIQQNFVLKDVIDTIVARGKAEAEEAARQEAARQEAQVREEEQDPSVPSDVSIKTDKDIIIEAESSLKVTMADDGGMSVQAISDEEAIKAQQEV